MGVHDKDKYPEIKRLLGIPEDEPIFILRAQDDLSADTISDYRLRYVRQHREPDPDFVSQLNNKIVEIEGWQFRNSSKVKFPD